LFGVGFSSKKKAMVEEKVSDQKDRVTVSNFLHSLYTASKSSISKYYIFNIFYGGGIVQP